MIAPSETIMPGERPDDRGRPAGETAGNKEIEMKSVTVAGIDCGTNSIRLKIARVDDQGMHEIVPRILRVIRLGQDVDKTHRFAQDALDRAYTAAAEFAGVLAQHPVDAIRFVATSATAMPSTATHSRMASSRYSACAPKSSRERRRPI